jgi:hypothetical protein
MGLSFSGALTPTGRTTTRANKAPTWSSTGNLGQTLGGKPFTANLLGTDPEGATVKYGIYDGGVLPSGISLNTETGVLSGTPINNPGVKTFPIYVTDGVDTVPQTFTLEIQNATPVWATLAGSLGTINENTAFSISLSATDENLDTLTFTITAGTLPPGLTLASDGTISGTTGQVNQNTVYNFTVQVNDGATGISSRAFSLTVNNNINEPPVWSTAAGSLGILNEQTEFSYNLSVIDPDVNDTITYNISSGTLPIGLSLNTATGVISGNTGVATGNVLYEFIIGAQDGHNPIIYRSFSITVLNNINEPPVWTTAAGNLGSVTSGAATSFTLVATDPNSDTITYSIVSGALPTGLTMTTSGVISGTTTSSGTYNITVRATDINAGTTDRAFSFTVSVPNKTLWTAGKSSSSIYSKMMGFNSPVADKTTFVQVGTVTNWAMVDWDFKNVHAIDTTGTMFTWGQATGSNAPVQVGAANSWKKLAIDAMGTGKTAIQTDNTLWLWGQNQFGQCGTGATGAITSPTKLGTNTWIDVSSGYGFTMAIRSDGTLWSCGKNNYGQLGLNDTANRSSMAQVGTATTWASVSSAREHTLAVRTDGTLWAWGKNGKGELGLSDTSNRSNPTQVGLLTDWKTPVAGRNIFVGNGFGLSIKTDGTLWGWGYNGGGQLSQGNLTHKSSPVQVGSASNWAQVGAGSYGVMGVRSDGSLWAWGGNHSGLLGLGHTGTPVTSMTRVGIGTNWVQAVSARYNSFALQQ